MTDLKRELGFKLDREKKSTASERQKMVQYINLRLIASGLPAATDGTDSEFESIAKSLLDNFREKARLLSDYRCPADERIEQFMADYFGDMGLDEPLRLPGQTLLLARHGVARELSLPVKGHKFTNHLVESVRVKNGVLHNPRHDRRTTQGTFHVVEGGLPIPNDKKSVPREVFVALYKQAMNPPADSMELPFTSELEETARTFVTLLLRPLVCPHVPGVCSSKTMETRFFAPGSLVSNLDFVETIFGNAGDPSLPENDAALDTEHWTGHTGAVILAPHLSEFTKKELGLPHINDATDRQKRDGMCYEKENEKYNDGTPFKLTCRDENGVIVTLIADNYFGYCKKEVKTQLSYAANLYGNVEEEHAGGAIAYSTQSLGDNFRAEKVNTNSATFEQLAANYSDFIDVQPEGYGIDKNYPDIIYVCEDTRINLPKQRVTWKVNGELQHITLLPGKTYITPSGYKVRMEKHPAAPSWRLVGSDGEGTFCHKPCTVSGGGKSEISKSLRDYMLYGPIFVSDINKDMDKVEEIFNADISKRWRADLPALPTYYKTREPRSALNPTRSLGSLIKMLTPSDSFSVEYNNWLDSIPNYIYAQVFVIKRFYNPDWGDNWREHFHVDIVNGSSGHELKFDDHKLVGSYLRVGLIGKQDWRTYKLRQDFVAADKIQIEDDISASVVVPTNQLENYGPIDDLHSLKFISNCEYRLFQRPDDAIHLGLDKQTEYDMSLPRNFLSNYQPLDKEQTRQIIENAHQFDAYTDPMKNFLKSSVEDGRFNYTVCSSRPRLVDGVATKNPRYLQDRPDLVDPIKYYVAEVGTRLSRQVPADKGVLFPVHSTLVGRRNNPPGPGIRPLAVYGPIHYQELPELFMDFISSLTGKSPSTTGAGTEGALTKTPFNALSPIIDLNNALVSYILTGHDGYSSAAGYIGPEVKVEHDISLLIPEIWCRLYIKERDPKYLIEKKMLEKIEDFEHEGQKIPGSRLGYRITEKFVRTFMGRIFDNPEKVFDENLLQPECQNYEAYVDGILNICEAHQKVAKNYLEDGSIEMACPPLRALLMIMANGDFEGKSINDPEVRGMFTRDYLLNSDWYAARLVCKQERDIKLATSHKAYLESFLQSTSHAEEATRLDIQGRLDAVEKELAKVSSTDYLTSLTGTLGADPM